MLNMRKQGGFSLVEVLLIILALGFVVFAGYAIWNNQQGKEKDSASIPENSNDNKSEPVSSITETDGSANDDTSANPKLNLEDLSKSSDISKLPDYTPDSFRAYFLDILQENENSTKDCTFSYSIYYIDSDSVRGGVVPVEKNGAFCGSGAPLRWVNSGGTWIDEPVQ